MTDLCQKYRDRWLEHALDVPASEPDEHAEKCVACAEWRRAVSAQVAALRSMERFELPGSMDEVVHEDLSRSVVATERLLAALPRLEAPAELEERVASLLEVTHERAAAVESREDDHFAKAVGTLDYSMVPPVLDRLVSEELADPDVHVAERFVGNLESLQAPARLDVLVRRRIRRHRVPLFAGLATLAAASLVAWLVLNPLDRDAEQRRSLRWVRAASLDELDPLARGFVEALGSARREEGER
jgi:hypothetical protein